jgi:plasmid stabilization system protein ParE
MEAPKRIAWSKQGLKQFEKAYKFLKRDSEQNAENVRFEILEKIAKAAVYPEIFSLEKYKKNNDGSYRYFEKHHLRVTYRVLNDAIWIVRVRHTKMRPSVF